MFQPIVITIPNYIREVKVSESQRPRYWEWDGTSIHSKRKPLLKKYLNPLFRNKDKARPEDLDKDYAIGVFNSKKELLANIYGDRKDVLCLQTSVPIIIRKVLISSKLIKEKEDIKFLLYNIKTDDFEISNPNQVDKPKYIRIKGQDIYSGVMNEFTRGKIMDAIKAQYKEYCKNIPKIEYYPIRIHVELFDTIDNIYDKAKSAWDLDNRLYPYKKAFPDFLQAEGIIENDDRLHVSDWSECFSPIKEGDTPSIQFIIEYDSVTARKFEQLSQPVEEKPLEKINFNI